MHQLDITTDQILEARASWLKMHRTIFDVIVQATEKSIPSEVLGQLNEPGRLIFKGSYTFNRDTKSATQCYDTHV